MNTGKRMAGGGSVMKGKGKNSKQELLPSRHALTQLTKGDTFQRSVNNYSKKTPAALDVATPNIFGMKY